MPNSSATPASASGAKHNAPPLRTSASAPIMRLAPSILSAYFARLHEACAAVEAGGGDWLHVDVMDGHFVPNLTLGPVVVSSLRKATRLPLDCHLMVTNPEFLVPLFAQAGAHTITVHAESTVHLDRLLHQIQELGCVAGVSLNPATPLSVIEHVIPWVDMVLIMSVNPGFGGQKLIPYCLDKVRHLRELRPDLEIQVDGGVKLDNVAQVVAAGATNIVAGSAVFDSADVPATIRHFKRLMAGQ